MNKRKILNDPVYGFVSIPNEIIFDLIEHPWFQRLRRIQQLGLTSYVYPGALHTRFHHALGAMHLMGEALDVLRSKGHSISDEEAEAAAIAILLHDIGHGPYSHTLERSIIHGLGHEEISILLMEKLNREFKGRLSLAIRIFKDQYEKRFLHQLVSSQLDMDRLDYLNRDSFFTGVYEGVIGYDRIIKMLEVRNDRLVVEAKGIYSVEKFIIARRLMYWQVYLHKTVLAAELMLWKALLRAKELAQKGVPLFATPSLKVFLMEEITNERFYQDEGLLHHFTQLDDYDLFTAIKVWAAHGDKVLSILCRRIVNRRLLKVALQDEPPQISYMQSLKDATVERFGLSAHEVEYLVFSENTTNHAYSTSAESINILYKDNTVKDITVASDQLNISVLSQPVVKYYLCFPKELMEVVKSQ